MDLHRLGEERSIAYHRVIAERLPVRPEIVDDALDNLNRWMARGGASMPYFRRWQEILAQPMEKIAAFIVNSSEDARTMRSCSPFAGLIDPRERLRIWDEVRERLEKSA